jgi:uncharacterized protein
MREGDFETGEGRASDGESSISGPPYRFERYQLRTTDVGAASAFYAAVFGPEFWSAPLSASALPERALALGARPHWLGHVGVDDPLGMGERLVAAGAEQLGPTFRESDGAPFVVLREAFGAMLAVGQRRSGSAPGGGRVAWHALHALDLDRALAHYTALFGWVAGDPIELGAAGVPSRLFSWDGTGRSAGSMSALARGVHAQWLYCFATSDLEASLSRVRGHGGHALPPLVASNGARVAACDDPQGAAFALYQQGRGY